MKRKKTEVVVELNEVFVIRRRQIVCFAWCGECGAQVPMLTPDEAATLSGLSPRLIYRRVEAGNLHFSETADGHLLVCQRSLCWAEEFTQGGRS